MKNRINLIFLVLTALLVMIFAFLGAIGFFNNKKQKNNQENYEFISTKEINKQYYENLEESMNLYFSKDGYFTGTNYLSDGSLIQYKILNNYDLHLIVNYGLEKHIASNVLLVKFYRNINLDSARVQYIDKYQKIYDVTEISQNGLIFKISYSNFEVPEEDEYLDITKRYLNKINNVKKQYKSYYESLNSNKNDIRGTNLPTQANIYEYFSNINFITEYDIDTLILKYDDKIIDDDVLQTKIIYLDSGPILYYWKADGYWYSYDYFNKEEPIKTKIDLENIIDVRQFTYDTGETIQLFVDIEGNLKEFK